MTASPTATAISTPTPSMANIIAKPQPSSICPSPQYPRVRLNCRS